MSEAVVKIIDGAADFIRRGHCKGVFARDEKGRECRAGDRRAASWCVRGAIYRAAMATHGAGSLDAQNAVEVVGARMRADTGFYIFLHEWNDRPETQQGDVLALLARARDAGKAGA